MNEKTARIVQKIWERYVTEIIQTIQTIQTHAEMEKSMNERLVKTVLKISDGVFRAQTVIAVHVNMQILQLTLQNET